MNTEWVVRTIAETAIENEKYFGDLDSVVGDGDFGYSLARGFEKLLETWDDLDRSSSGAFLKRTGMTIASRIGGTSGPIWGTAFIRAGAAATTASGAGSSAGAGGSAGAGSSAGAGGSDVDGRVVVEMLRAAIEGIKARGQSDVGDKTLLDALVPLTDRLSQSLSEGASPEEAIRAASAAAREAADATSGMVAKRGRAAYTGERSRGSVDAGAMAVAVIAERISETWKQGAAS
ncbi:dihydroxyacetone kinase subunit DhaL [Paractinoplanes atraurantiacus]|uniref:Dihydroxyacetone kinase/dihydroxyacetone kinase, C-terminal domain n=1 Tax=Paractinoplanes atraurantiacus TaxID=1036182 RepID=A0A285HR73_9ACTN|nr:dihydroxyacetone kinase subunit DhaL [Actinoplanes atraurantiacus]SNY38184.1 dihydroxyacetone kinase/dihydroxyacetone kinase, C-terminal domain [Actinoplanes atraurantiacus]